MVGGRGLPSPLPACEIAGSPSALQEDFFGELRQDTS